MIYSSSDFSFHCQPTSNATAQNKADLFLIIFWLWYVIMHLSIENSAFCRARSFTFLKWRYVVSSSPSDRGDISPCLLFTDLSLRTGSASSKDKMRIAAKKYIRGVVYTESIIFIRIRQIAWIGYTTFAFRFNAVSTTHQNYEPHGRRKTIQSNLY